MKMPTLLNSRQIVLSALLAFAAMSGSGCATTMLVMKVTSDAYITPENAARATAIRSDDRTIMVYALFNPMFNTFYNYDSHRAYVCTQNPLKSYSQISEGNAEPENPIRYLSWKLPQGWSLYANEIVECVIKDHRVIDKSQIPRREDAMPMGYYDVLRDYLSENHVGAKDREFLYDANTTPPLESSDGLPITIVSFDNDNKRMYVSRFLLPDKLNNPFAFVGYVLLPATVVVDFVTLPVQIFLYQAVENMRFGL